MKAIYSNLGGGAYFHLFLVLTNVQYALISLTPFVYPTHPGPLIVPDGTTAHKSSNMKIAHTEEVHLFLEVTGFEQALVRQIVATVKEEYLADICNHTTKSISDTMEDVLTHLQEKTQSVDDPQNSRAQGHRQEDDIPFSGTDRDCIIHRQRISWV